MQVRSRVPNSRSTHRAEALAGFHPFADLHVVAREVRVEGDHSVSMVDFHEQSPRSHVAMVDDRSTPGFQGDVRSPFPIDASKRDGALRNRTHGLT
jgi:hypothetical protein